MSVKGKQPALHSPMSPSQSGLVCTGDAVGWDTWMPNQCPDLHCVAVWGKKSFPPWPCSCFFSWELSLGFPVFTGEDYQFSMVWFLSRENWKHGNRDWCFQINSSFPHSGFRCCHYAKQEVQHCKYHHSKRCFSSEVKRLFCERCFEMDPHTEILLKE